MAASQAGLDRLAQRVEILLLALSRIASTLAEIRSRRAAISHQALSLAASLAYHPIRRRFSRKRVGHLKPLLRPFVSRSPVSLGKLLLDPIDDPTSAFKELSRPLERNCLPPDFGPALVRVGVARFAEILNPSQSSLSSWTDRALARRA
jgi:hypothetical protein